MAIQKWNVANAKYLRHKNQKKSTNKSSSSGMVFMNILCLVKQNGMI